MKRPGEIERRVLSMCWLTARDAKPASQESCLERRLALCRLSMGR